MNIVFLQLGSNLGDRELLLKDSIFLIQEKIGVIEEYSKIYESAPWRVEGQKNYLNQMLKVETILSAENVLSEILNIENKLGRVRLEKWGERLIDIDIILYNDSIIETPKLCVPHKHLHERMFVLKPLYDIDPEIIHPIYKKSIKELLKICNDIYLVKEYAL